MVHFDAHSDTWDTYFGGYKYTHGTPFRRAVEEGLLDPKRVVQIGIRGSMYKRDDNDWAVEKGMRVITIEDWPRIRAKNTGNRLVMVTARRVGWPGTGAAVIDTVGSFGSKPLAVATSRARVAAAGSPVCCSAR